MSTAIGFPLLLLSKILSLNTFCRLGEEHGCVFIKELIKKLLIILRPKLRRRKNSPKFDCQYLIHLTILYQKINSMLSINKYQRLVLLILANFLSFLDGAHSTNQSSSGRSSRAQSTFPLKRRSSFGILLRNVPSNVFIITHLLSNLN